MPLEIERFICDEACMHRLTANDVQKVEVVEVMRDSRTTDKEASVPRRYMSIGPTTTGRLLRVIWEETNGDRWKIITAKVLSDDEEMSYLADVNLDDHSL